MTKPILARPPRQFRSRLVRIDREPVLAAFVEDIAGAVHAPKPKRIEVDCMVNASAGFGRGLFGALRPQPDADDRLAVGCRFL